MKKILLAVFSIAFGLSATAQSLMNATVTANSAKGAKAPDHRTCGVLDHETDLELQDPARAAQRQAYEQQLQLWMAAHQNQINTQAAITIPVVVHVVYNNATQNISAAQVQSQIDVLNQDFTHTNPDIGSVPAPWTSTAANIDMNFCLAQQDPTGLPTTGIHRVSTSTTSFSTNDNVKHTATGGTDAWDPSRYFNIWVCNLGGGLLGYAEFPTGTLSQTYGLVVGYFCFGSNYTPNGSGFPLLGAYDRGRTSTHEIGHCFNLRHIWGDDGTACTGSDLVADTPNQSSENYGCPAYPHTDACTATSPGVMFMNYMDYTDDACMYMFSNGQKTRILAVVNNAPYNTLQTSTACTPPAAAPPVALFAANTTSACPGNPITFTNQTTVNATAWSWTFPSGSPASSTAQNPPSVTWSTPGTYTVTLVASNVNGNSTYTMAVTILGPVNPPLVEGFEAATYPPTNWSLNDAGNDGQIWSRANVGHNSSWSSLFDNYNLNVNGTRDDLRTPRMNFSTAATGTLTFDVSHRRYSTVATEQDTLEVLVSTNCGATWTQVYIKGSSTLATVTGTQTTAFIPANTQWRTETVNLNAYVGQAGVMIAFRNRGHWGNNIYVDNVNITTTVSALPSATFTASATTVCRGTPVSFTDNSTNSPTSWTWTFPSGTPASATTQNVASVVWNTAGTYTVTHTATNASGTGTTTQVITVNATPTVTTTTSGGTICSGNSTTITASGGTTYTWMPGSLSGSPVTVSPTTTTTYTVTGTNAAGCTSTATRTITVNTSPTVVASSATTTICSGSSTTLTATGASTYNWMPGSLNGTPVTVSPTTTTTYTVTGTAANGCTGTSTRVITVNPTPTVTTTTSTTTICSGSSATITANGATTYTWMPGSLSGSPVTVSPTTTTTYTVTGTSAGCSGTATRVITVNPSPTVTTTTSGGTICSGSSTTITASGGTTYNWMPGSLSGSPVTVSPTTTTTYTVTGTAANGCTSTATRVITVNPSPTVAATAGSPSICAGSSTTLTGTGASTYAWMPGSLNGATVTVTPAGTTTYTVTGTGANGCTGTQTVLVTVTPTPTITTTTSGGTICSGSSTTITANGGTTYTWMPGSLSGSPVTVSPTTTTTYTVTGTTAGCSSTATRVITVNPSPTVAATAGSPTICSGSSSTLTGTGASTYNWMPGSLSGTTVSVTPAGTTTYTVTGTAANGCTGTQTVLVTVTPTPTITTTTSGGTICSGNSTTITASGGTTYTWMPGSLSGSPVTVSPTTTTTYTVTGTTAGCSGTATRVITVNPSPTVTTTTSGGTICSGSSTTITANGGTTYSWMPGPLSGSPVTVTPSTTTTYTVTGTAANGCTGTATRVITVNTSPTVTANASSTSICTGNNVTLTGGGASTYNWMPGSLSGSPVTTTPASTTTYTVTGTAANGCTGTETVAITVGPQPTITASASSPVICDGNNTTLTASGGTTYNWMPGSLSGSSVTVTPTITTTYTVTGTNGPGCSNVATITVTVNALPAVAASSSLPAICSGDAVTLTGSGASVYSWMPGSLSGSPVTDIPAASVTYTVTGTDANGCSNTSTVAVTVNALPSITASASGPAVCIGDAVTLSGSGGTTYNWMPGSLSGSPVTDIPAASTTYTVTGTDVNGCSNTSTVAVTVNALPSITASASGPAICEGDAVTLTGSGGTTYNWMPGSLNGSPVTDIPAASTTYTVTGMDANGCSSTSTVTVTVNTLPVVTASSSAGSICSGSQVTLTGSGASTYNWMPGSLSGSSVNDIPAGSTTYTVTGTDINGCSNTSTVSVTVNAPPVVTLALANDTFCIADGPTALNGGSPAGGNYSGPGVSGNSFDASSLGAGTYTVTYTYSDVNGCSDSAAQSVVVDICNGIDAPSADPIIGVVPNPNNGEFVLTFDIAQSDDYTLEIHNSLGQVVYSEELNGFTGHYSNKISLAEFGRGAYTIRLRSSDKEIIQRVITY